MAAHLDNAQQKQMWRHRYVKFSVLATEICVIAVDVTGREENTKATLRKTVLIDF